MEARFPMARPKSLASLSVNALLKLRDNIGTALGRRADELRRQLSSLAGTDVGNGRKRRRKRRSLKGHKVAPKYRSRIDPKLTWAGRGATPLWMRQEMKGGKLKKEAFLIK